MAREKKKSRLGGIVSHLEAPVEALKKTLGFTDPSGLTTKEQIGQLALAQSEALAQIAQISREKAAAEKRIIEQQAQIDSLLSAPTAAATNGRLRIGILSGYYPNTRFNSDANHRLYADQHGYCYIFDSAPRYDTRAYMRKLEAVQEYLGLFDWLFWIDDDAYFTDFSVRLESFIAQAPGAEFIACKSPSTKTTFTFISSGQLLIKNTQRAKDFISDALKVNLSDVKKWWQPELGMYTGGDQDALVYLMKTNPSYAPSFFASILDHQQFNNRPFEYEANLEEHFVVHFTGKQKALDKARFCQRLGCNEYLCPPYLLDTLAIR